MCVRVQVSSCVSMLALFYLGIQLLFHQIDLDEKYRTTRKAGVPAPNLVREKSWDPSFHEKSWTFTIFLNHEKSGDAPILLKKY